MLWVLLLMTMQVYTPITTIRLAGTIEGPPISSLTALLEDGDTIVRRGDALVNEPLPTPSSSEAFPVGAVYINVTGVNPATELGYGTWSAFGAGRMLIGYDSGTPAFATALATGGAYTNTPTGTISAPTISGSTAAESSHTHSVTSNVAVAAHSFTQPTLSWPAGVPTFAGNALAAHQHELPFYVSGTTFRIISPSTFGQGTSRAATAGGSFSANTNSNNVSYSENVSAGTPSGTISWPAGVPTAASGAVDAHAVTNNAVTSGAGSAHSHGTGTLAASAPSFAGAAMDIVPPYVVVHLWRRTA